MYDCNYEDEIKTNLLNSFPEQISIIDETGNVEWINECTEEFLGRVLLGDGEKFGDAYGCINSKDKGCGKSVNCNLCSVTLKVNEFYKDVASLVNKEKGQIEFELKLQETIQDTFHLLISTRSITYKGENRLLLIINDITERKKAQSLQAALEVSSAVHHEINQPLSAILLSAHLMSKDSADLPNMIDILVRSSKRIKKSLSKLSKIKDYVVCDYVDGIKMLDIKSSLDEESNEKAI